jgi:DNA-binding MarR family transcriptional regulator
MSTRHIMTTAPSVNNMIKTFEARGFLTRVPARPGHCG